MENLMDMGSTFGQMEATIKEILRTVSEMEMVYGKRIRARVINMKDNMPMIKKMGMVSSHGLVEIAIQETTKQMLGKAMVK